jgi:hypothetical protein
MGFNATQVAVGNSAGVLVLAPLSYEVAIVYNSGTKTAYLGPADTVTATGTTRGFPLPAGAKIRLRAEDETDDLYARCAAGDTTTLEVAT